MSQHVSILAEPLGGVPSVYDVLRPVAGERVLDVTLGLGGHAKGFLERVGPSGSLVALDADSANIALAQAHLGQRPNVTIVHRNFGSLSDNLGSFDVIFADLGLSSPHLDEPERGFSYRHDQAPLDMRFDRSGGETAQEWLATASVHELATAFRLGEVPQPGRLATIIVETRLDTPLNTASDLKRLCERVYGFRAAAHFGVIFQAIRMRINHETSALEHLLHVAPRLLRPGGRLGIITFHSLEDRLVKQAFRALCTVDRDPLTGADVGEATYTLLLRKALVPSDEEITGNPRARSAKFRAVTRTVAK